MRNPIDSIRAMHDYMLGLNCKNMKVADMIQQLGIYNFIEGIMLSDYGGSGSLERRACPCKGSTVQVGCIHSNMDNCIITHLVQMNLSNADLTMEERIDYDDYETNWYHWIELLDKEEALTEDHDNALCLKDGRGTIKFKAIPWNKREFTAKKSVRKNHRRDQTELLIC